jgi:inhibitor of cysteine peptidase
MARPGTFRLAGLVIVAMAVGIGACGSGAAIELSAADAGTTVEAKVGDPIVISLEANPTTGYSWQLQPGLDDAVVTFVKEEYQQEPAPSGLVGAGGTDRLEFKAVGPGTTRISLAYLQAGSGAGDDTFEVEVTVQ